MLSYKNTGIHKYIFDRLLQIHDEIIKDDPEYLELGKRPDELLKQISAKLASEAQKLLNEYRDIWVDQINRQDELVYSQGLMDGMALVIGWRWWMSNIWCNFHKEFWNGVSFDGEINL